MSIKDDLGLIAVLAFNFVVWVAMVIFLMPIMCWWAITGQRSDDEWP